MFGVSRTALREALQMLNIQGLVTIRKGSGIYVCEYGPSNVLKVMSCYLEMNLNSDLTTQVEQVSMMFESQIASMAARNRDEEDL